MSEAAERRRAGGWLDGLLLAASLLLANAGAVAVVFLLWQYLPAHAAAFACLGLSLPLSTRLVLSLSNWTVRLLPLLALVALPFTGAVIGVAYFLAARARLRVLRVLAALALAVACAQGIACGLVVHSVRAAYHAAGCDSGSEGDRARCLECRGDSR